MANPRLCSAGGCDKVVHAFERCRKHYRAWRKIHPSERKPPASSESIGLALADAVRSDSEDCLAWPFGRTNAGYGTATIEGEKIYVHRVVCERANGPAPTPRHEVAHSCGNGHMGCVNPRHLHWATRAENIADKLKHGTHNRGQRHPLAQLTDDDVRSIRRLRGLKSQRAIAAIFGVSQSAVNDIQNGKRWGWLH